MYDLSSVVDTSLRSPTLKHGVERRARWLAAIASVPECRCCAACAIILVLPAAIYFAIRLPTFLPRSALARILGSQDQPAQDIAILDNGIEHRDLLLGAREA